MLNPIDEQGISKQEYNRYARQIILEEIGSKGQLKLKQSKILCIGAGGLNSPILLYLAACGIGTIGVIDNDTIEISNLQRQIIYNQKSLNKKKVKSAFNTLKSLNPFIVINSYNKYLTQNNVNELILYYDIVIDGTDNFAARYIISQYCYKLHKIHIYGAIEKFIGQISVFNYQNGPHYYTLYSKVSNIRIKKCSEGGIFNTLASLTGTLQATEAIKIILGIGSVFNSYLLVFNILQYSTEKIKIKQNRILEKISIKTSYKKREHYVSLNDLEKHNENLYQLIDIRTLTEFQKKHIKTAINIPLTLIKQETFIKNLKNSLISILIIYCDNESRSYIASQILHKHNIKHYILKNGIDTTRKERDSNPR